MIEYIKPKQDDHITKDLIKKQQLEQSMLRFKRYYLSEKNTYEPDESSTEYSRLMTESKKIFENKKFCFPALCFVK